MVKIKAPICDQVLLFEYINEDDEILLNSPNAEWYRLLKNFLWEDYRELGAAYYNALYNFNISKSHLSQSTQKNNETKEEACQRLLFDRTTMDKSKSVLFETPPSQISTEVPLVSPDSVSPGVVPPRKMGKKPKCFFALFKSFLGVTLMGFPPEPEMVFNQLFSNLSFARVCGFVPNIKNDTYWFKNIPSLRKLEQFDQIMTEYGLWSQNKWDEVRRNIENGIIKKESELVGDTTHYHAFSGFETVQYKDDKGREKTKSQSKVTKNCRCKNQDDCPHEWELADDGAGTIVKSNKKMIWGHKASVIVLPLQGIPLDVTAIADGATFDGETFYPHLLHLFNQLPEIKPWITTVLYDSACDNHDLKWKFEDNLEIDLKTSLNPRRNKTVTENLPKGMGKLTPYGNLICNAGITMDYQGCRYETEKFIYQAPISEKNTSVCQTCNLKHQCCPGATKGRVVNISFDLLSHINPGDPPMAKRFKAIMTRRPSVERMIKRLKCDMSDDRLKKRSNECFQAYLDKSFIAFQILLRQ